MFGGSFSFKNVMLILNIQWSTYLFIVKAAFFSVVWNLN